MRLKKNHDFFNPDFNQKAKDIGQLFRIDWIFLHSLSILLDYWH